MRAKQVGDFTMRRSSGVIILSSPQPCPHWSAATPKLAKRCTNDTSDAQGGVR
jgi:hypothetical protein